MTFFPSTRPEQQSQRPGIAAPRFGLALVFLISFGFIAAPGYSQESSNEVRLNVQRFSLAPQVDGFTRVLGAEQPHKAEFGLVGSLNYALNPFELADDDNKRSVGVVDHLLGLDLAAAAVANQWLRFGATLPIVQLRQNSQASEEQATALGASKSGVGVGDLSLSAGLQALRQERSGLSLAVVPRFVFPTGTAGDFVSSGNYGLGGDVALARDFRVLHATATLGAEFRTSPAQLSNIYSGSEMRWGLGIGVPVGKKGWEIQAEYVGATGINKANDNRPDYKSFDPLHSPQEVTLGVAFNPNGKWSMAAAAGPGLGKGFGTPDARAFAKAGWSSRKADRDADGVADRKDACRDDAEDMDGFEDEDGCPDLDNDADGIADMDDDCPDEPETMNSFDDDDGCPDGPGDQDHDGIADTDDACPQDPEDEDGHQDDDGCPDLDNDFDGIADVMDDCPDEPEVFNAVKDEDGCPDEALVVIEKEGNRMARIAILRKVYFDVAKASIRMESFPVLDAVAEVLTVYPEILSVEVAGHTDSDGSDSYNETLSQARVESVVTYLTSVGIDASRLVPQGYGESRPIANNSTTEGKQRNRRVEFVILNVENAKVSSVAPAHSPKHPDSSTKEPVAVR